MYSIPSPIFWTLPTGHPPYGKLWTWCGNFSDRMIPWDPASQWNGNEASKWLSIKWEKVKQKCMTQSIIDSSWISKMNSKLKLSRGSIWMLRRRICPHDPYGHTHQLPCHFSPYLFVCQKDRSTNYKQWGKWQFKSNKVKKNKKHEKRNWNHKVNVYNIVPGGA